ncbi:MAG: YihY/virulence factor BrkB family protein [Caldimonas sp.]
MKPKHIWPLVKASATAWSDDYAPSMGAALAYYTLFSIAPLLLIVISIGGLVFGQDAARGQLFDQLRDLMGDQTALAIQALLKNASKPSQGIVATAVGLVAVGVGAMSIFGELQSSLDRIWRAPVDTTGSGLLKLVRSRLLSFGMILGLGLLLIVSLVASTAMAALARWWTPGSGHWTVIAELVNVVLSFALVSAGFAMIYKVLPRVRIQWRDVLIGATATAVLFTIGKFLIGFYLGHATVASGFGAAGSLVVMLVWVYYSAQIFLLGAEFTWVYAHTCGSRSHVAPVARSTAVPCRSGNDAGEAIAASRAEVADEIRAVEAAP